LASLECRKKRILVANRGEIAIRITKAIKELGYVAVGVYSDIDENSPHLFFADEAYHIGPSEAAKSYLNIDKIIAISKKNNIDAIHPGYGFLAENSNFAKIVEENNFIWIGPPYKVMYDAGDKLRARKLAQKAGVPIVPGASLEKGSNPIEQANELGYPVLIKASGGGGGKGMRIANNDKELIDSIDVAKKEAEASFSDPTVYLEKYILDPHHIEIQIMADNFGNYYYFPERECSIQRRYQKIIEESPSTTINREKAKMMGEAAVSLAKEVGYRSAGTVEFLVDKDKNFYFLEINARIQVEHPITEEITNIDLVESQIKMAFGNKLLLNQKELNKPVGHAIEARVYAENPSNNFMPDAGIIKHYKRPSNAGVRIDSGGNKGAEIPIYYDPIISKVIAKGSDRKQALVRLYNALSGYHIYPIKTNIKFLMNIIKHSHFANGTYNTKFIDTHFEELSPITNNNTPLAIACYYYLNKVTSGGGLTSSENKMEECWTFLKNFRG